MRIQNRLEAALERLKKISALGMELEVTWLPSKETVLSGEVRQKVIYVYEEDSEMAVETLHHEFLDYCISNIIEPYKRVTNKLISLINEEAYEKKERVIEAVIRLLNAKAAEDV
jgi:hypothetical protein